MDRGAVDCKSCHQVTPMMSPIMDTFTKAGEAINASLKEIAKRTSDKFWQSHPLSADVNMMQYEMRSPKFFSDATRFIPKTYRR